MAVYGRIEEVSETIQSNEIENRLDKNLESHVEKEEQVAFPFFRLIIGSTIATFFFCGDTFTFRYGKSLSGAGFVYRVGFTSGRTDLQ